MQPAAFYLKMLTCVRLFPVQADVATVVLVEVIKLAGLYWRVSHLQCCLFTLVRYDGTEYLTDGSWWQQTRRMKLQPVFTPFKVILTHMAIATYPGLSCLCVCVYETTG